MNAIILSAGFGTRLGDLTREVPKPMLDVAGRPLVEYTLRHLAERGFDRVGMNLHFRPEAIRDHFGDGRRCGLRIEYSSEPTLLGTAGGVRQLVETYGAGGPLLVHYGDVVTNHDHAAMLREHRDHGALATMLVHHRPGSNSIVERDHTGRVVRFWERPTEAERQHLSSGWANSGICILEPEVIDLIPPGTSDLARDLFPRLVASERLYTYELAGFRCAIDSPERLTLAREAVRDGTCRFAWQAASTSLQAA